MCWRRGGTMHGMLKSMVAGKTKKHVDPARIAAIRPTGKPLTLHGGSGTDDQGFLDAIQAGITIVHINTELRVAWRRGLIPPWQGSRTKWSRVSRRTRSNPSNK